MILLLQIQEFRINWLWFIFSGLLVAIWPVRTIMVGFKAEMKSLKKWRNIQGSKNQKSKNRIWKIGIVLIQSEFIQKLIIFDFQKLQKTRVVLYCNQASYRLNRRCRNLSKIHKIHNHWKVLRAQPMKMFHNQGCPKHSKSRFRINID